MAKRHRVAYLLALLLPVLFSFPARAQDLRTWTSTNGATLEARLKGIKSGRRVVLEKSDGTPITVPAARLSDDDQAYVRQWLKEQKKTSTAEPSPAVQRPARKERNTGKRGDFFVFDAIQYRNKPESFGTLPIHPIRVIYRWEMWNGSEGLEAPNIEKKRETAKALEPSDFPYIIDIEHWKVDGNDEEVRENIRKYIQTIQCMRKEKPDSEFGFYGLLPIRDYWSPVDGKSGEMREWQRKNKRLGEIAQHVDAVFPSIYAFYPDVPGWEKCAKANLKEARQYGKPVYAFLWPEYHDSNKELAGQWLPGRYWAKQLKLCRRYADGIVIWSSNDKDWDSNAEWWQETERFLRKLSR